MLSAADEYGIKVFIGNGYWGSLYKPTFLMTDPGIREMRIKTMAEIAENYGQHDSFYGWYFPNEIHLIPYFSDVAIDYVNECSSFAKQLTPACVTLIAPYNVKNAVYDKKFVKQLE